MSVNGAVLELEKRHAVRLSEAAVAKLCSGRPGCSAAHDLLTSVLRCDLKEVTLAGLLPRDIGSQQAATLINDVMVQIESVRDVTQPLRPHADMDEADGVWGAANQKMTDTRLLRLTVTDGHVTVPAIELKTHKDVFRALPIPGEKLRLCGGAQVRNGMVVITPEHVSFLGGEVEAMKREFLMHRGAVRPSSRAVDGAPPFEPFRALSGGSLPASSALSAPAALQNPSRRPQFAPPMKSSESQGRGGSANRIQPQRRRDEQGRGGRGAKSGRARGGNAQNRGRGGEVPSYRDPASFPREAPKHDSPLPHLRDARSFPTL